MFKKIKIILLLFFVLIAIQTINAQAVGGGGGNRIESDYKFMPIPYINYNRSYKFQFGAIPMIQFNPVKNDTLSPSSFAGLMGLYTTNKTYLVMGFSRLYLDEDNWRITAAGGYGSMNFQFYINLPIDTWVPYNTKLTLFTIELQRRIYERIYFGLSYVHLKFNTSTEIIEGTLASNLNGVGAKVMLDNRNNVYYPTKGFLAKIQLFSYPEFMGNEVNSNKIQVSSNSFIPIRNNIDVLAFRLYAGIGLGDLTFNQQFIVGSGEDIRGYSQGEFRGNNMFALQGEYRWNIKDTRFGFVGFLGAATLADALNEEHNGKILPGIGVGFRYTVFEETHMNVGMDFAKGDGDWGIYFKIGESFNN